MRCRLQMKCLITGLLSFRNAYAFKHVMNIMRNERRRTSLWRCVASLTIVSAVYADHPETAFPAWTYYGEIVEHFGILAAALLGFIFLLSHRKKTGMNYILAGLMLLALSQLLVNMQHFLILYAGIFSAVIHHGLLLVSIVFLILGIHRLLASRK